jgi:DNA-binding sugar fermentation-stimulating protein
VRTPLLFGRSDVLKSAVAEVLRGAGMLVEDLDESMGTRSGDLLASYDGQHWLIEVKSSSGNLGESEAGALSRHLQSWPELRPETHLAGSCFVVSHQTRLPPAKRVDRPYFREEFTRSLQFPVVTAMSLFRWWADSDGSKIRGAICGDPGQA